MFWIQFIIHFKSHSRAYWLEQLIWYSRAVGHGIFFLFSLKQYNLNTRQRQKTRKPFSLLEMGDIALLHFSLSHDIFHLVLVFLLSKFNTAVSVFDNFYLICIICISKDPKIIRLSKIVLKEKKRAKISSLANLCLMPAFSDAFVNYCPKGRSSIKLIVFAEVNWGRIFWIISTAEHMNFIFSTKWNDCPKELLDVNIQDTQS